jgi:NAD(P)-dependent dehydrogenase (short-subunit alcohol dehydrogenase family)
MRTAAITGAGEGIGRVLALRFAKAGYRVSLADTNAEAGEETLGLVTRAGGGGLFEPADVALAADVERWMERTVSELGCPDVLVCNAGIGRKGPFLELDPGDFDRVIAVNLRGTFLCAQAAARRMVRRGQGGAIVTIASTRAFMSEPGTEAYTASKGGIVALTHGMAISLGPHGIRVNCVSPGWIETRDWKASPRAQKPAHSERDRMQHPVGRVGRPDDVADACLYLADSAGFVTGQNLIVDGGMTVKMIYEE